MLLNLTKGKQQLLVALLLLLSLSACKQSEFYEKQGLAEVSLGKDLPKDGGTGSEPGTTNPGNGGGGATNPPVVVNPPVVTPPIVVNPPVVNPPVVNPPVVNPPVVNPPVVNPPVVTPPIVVNPPVVNPPAEPPVVEDPIVLLNDRLETFTQNTGKSGDVDILWVIDDSGSMADEQDSLGRNFRSFIDQFIEKNVDFKMAITTTDGTSSRNGKMVGDSSKLTSEAAKKNKTQFINDFTKMVKVGTAGSGIEQGLKTSTSFTDRYASSFLRKEAFLIVVYISDEEDQSEKKVPEYLAKLLALKANKGLVKAYSLVSMKNYGYQWETLGKRYVEVSKATAGASADIKQDFATVLLDMGGRIVNLVDSFALSESPYQNKIEVFVNSKLVSSGYTFDSSSRSIKFDTQSLPAEGSKVEVRYKVQATVLGAI
jgi:hypothetical protein